MATALKCHNLNSWLTNLSQSLRFTATFFGISYFKTKPARPSSLCGPHILRKTTDHVCRNCVILACNMQLSMLAFIMGKAEVDPLKSEMNKKSSKILAQPIKL
jgi:hypothetical protein